MIDLMERSPKTLSDAAESIARVESDLFQELFLRDFGVYMVGFETLPSRLAGLSEQLAGLSARLRRAFAPYGKPGHKRQIFASQFLVDASESIRLKLGEYYDEHLADLLQAIAPPSDGEDFSGDAIRKKRNYLKRRYPAFYKMIVEKAENRLRSAPTN